MARNLQKAFPFARGSHTSYKAGEAQLLIRGVKTQRYLLALEASGDGLTDHEAYAKLRQSMLLAFTGIQAMRNNAMDCSLVEASGLTRKSPYGQPCNVYRLTEAGRVFAQALRTTSAATGAPGGR